MTPGILMMYLQILHQSFEIVYKMHSTQAQPGEQWCADFKDILSKAVKMPYCDMCIHNILLVVVFFNQKCVCLKYICMWVTLLAQRHFI